MRKELNIGDQLPDLVLKNQFGEEVSLHDHLGNSPLVVYFYPKDDTPGCTLEACSFRDQYQDFEDLGARVIGISKDSVESHARFAKRHRLEFTLLSDEQKIGEKKFGVKRDLFGLLSGRVTFVFDQQGILIHKFNSHTQLNQHMKGALRALRKASA